MSLNSGAVCGEGVWEGIMLLAWLSPYFQSLPSLPTSGSCPFRCWFLGGWACVHSSIPWASPTDSLVRLGVSPTATTSQVFTTRGFEALVLCWIPGLHGLSCSPVVPPGLSTCKCGTSQSASHCLPHLTWSASCGLVTHPLHPGFLSLPLFPVRINVSSLTPWLSYFHTVWFSGTSGCLLFLD